MSTNALRRSGGWTALLAGTLEMLGLVALVLFFTLELPQVSSGLRYGYWSDVIPILVAPVKLALVVILFLLQRKDSATPSAIAASLGVAGILLTAWTNIRFVSGEISLERQIQLFYLSMAFLAGWHILVNVLARQNGFLPSRLTTFGLLVGIGQLIMFGSSLLLGGYDEMLFSGFDGIARNIPLLISLVIGIPAALVGFLGAPFWLIWLGRTLVRGDQRMASLPELEARG